MKRAAFTRTELLVTLAAFALLLRVALPFIRRNQVHSVRAGCLDNLRRLALASQTYAHDDKDESLSGKTESEDQNLNWLWPHVREPKTFACPGTANFIRTNLTGRSRFTSEPGLTDLFGWAGTSRQVPGTSYQGFGFLGVDVPTHMDFLVSGRPRRVTGLRKTLKNIQTYAKYHDTFGLKGIVAGPSRQWIMADWEHAANWYYPDAGDNHGAAGGNVAFCDGHAE